jgi:hypothetical protein
MKSGNISGDTLFFFSGFISGYLALRGNSKYFGNGVDKAPVYSYGYAIFIVMFIIGSCIGLITILLPPAKTYIEHYTRFNSLSPPILSIVYICLIFKSGGYFVLLSLLFREYARYKILIFSLVAAICMYEVVFFAGISYRCPNNFDGCSWFLSLQSQSNYH